MAVSVIESAVIRIGDGVLTSFPFPFRVDQAQDVKVGYILESSVVAINPSANTVNVNPNNVGGTVDFLVAPALNDRMLS